MTHATKGRPKLGFLGVGWIGRHRMQAVAESGLADIVGVADPVTDMCEEARAVVPDAVSVESFDALLALDLDAVVIATPSAMHAEQSLAALERGLAVFCQKPVGRNANETRRVVEMAKRADRRLGVDLSYRHTEALGKVRDLVRTGELGDVYALDLAFHNAYGPDKDWFYDRARSGGGCVIDLGIHLVDAALWTLGFPQVEAVTSTLFHQGRRLGAHPTEVEDYAVARLDLEGGSVVQLACSWCLPAGQDAVIRAEMYGTEGGAALRNVGGSFYDFVAERYRGTAREVMAEPPDAWGGRAVVDWVRQLSADRGFDEEATRLVDVAEAIDRIYANE